MLLKTLTIAAGALLTVTLVSNQAASAAGYRPAYSTARQAVYARPSLARVAYRGTSYRRVGYSAGLTRARIYAPRRFAAARVFRPRPIGLVRGIAAYRTVARSRFVRGNLFARADQVIRTLVSPVFARPAIPSVGGGQVGRASYYALASRTASGGSVGTATCAHRYLPFGTRIRVTNLANAHSMVLTVNDRGPFTGGRILDVSRPAAGYLGMLQSGTAPVRIQVVGR